MKESTHLLNFDVKIYLKDRSSSKIDGPLKSRTCDVYIVDTHVLVELFHWDILQRYKICSGVVCACVMPMLCRKVFVTEIEIEKWEPTEIFSE